MQGKEGFTFSGEGEIGVVLDTHITEELKEEGMVREILSKVQNMRKERDFEVLDHIILYVAGDEKIENIIKKNEATIKRDTLTEKVVYHQEREDYATNNINGESLDIDVEVIK